MEQGVVLSKVTPTQTLAGNGQGFFSPFSKPQHAVVGEPLK
jgi:hypothetical protein